MYFTFILLCLLFTFLAGQKNSFVSVMCVEKMIFFNELVNWFLPCLPIYIFSLSPCIRGTTNTKFKAFSFDNFKLVQVRKYNRIFSNQMNQHIA